MKHSSRREIARFWRDPALDNLEILHATYVTHAFAPHIHEGYAIGVVEAGVETFLYRGQRHHVTAGQVVVVQPGEVHTGEAAVEHGWQYRMIYPSTALMRQAAASIPDESQDGCPVILPVFTQPVIDDPEWAQRFTMAHQSLVVHGSQLERESRLICALAQLIHRHADRGRGIELRQAEQRRMEEVRAVLEASYGENLSLAKLAQQVNLSQFHLLRSFHRSFGLPPHAYLNQVRINHAKRLLANGHSAADVAVRVGFSDQSHLNRHFKRTVGIPPGQYKAKIEE